MHQRKVRGLYYRKRNSKCRAIQFGRNARRQAIETRLKGISRISSLAQACSDADNKRKGEGSLETLSLRKVSLADLAA